jgi:hypothetical protein
MWLHMLSKNWSERGEPPRYRRSFVAANTARRGAYTFGGGNGSRAGSGRIFARMAFKV